MIVLNLLKVFFDEDADLSHLEGKVIGCIGYGHQGHAQSQNLRDNGLEVIIGNVSNHYAEDAKKAGFKVKSIDDVAKESDIIMMLISDEAHAEVYKNSIAPYLKKGMVLDFAHGYSINFKLIVPSPDVDIILVAPRMFGEKVRDRFINGLGTPAAVDVYQDTSGNAWDICLALAKGIGATKLPGGGAFEMTFAQEAGIDLFSEQAVWPAIYEIMLLALEVLSEAGYPPELVALEMYGSGEASEGFKAAAEFGFLKHVFELSSKTAQFGVLTKADKIMPEERKNEIKRSMKDILKDIREGEFVSEWISDQKTGNIIYQKLLDKALSHPINKVEDNLKKMFRKK
jgi:ketol-acid reductoisomerase